MIRRANMIGVTATLGVVASLTGCSLLVETSATQCSDDTECVALIGAGARCDAGLCTPPEDEIASTSSTGSSGTTVTPSSSSSTSTGEPESSSSSSAGDTSETDADTDSPDPAWACLSEPIPKPDGDVTLTIRFEKVVNGMPPEITMARLCALLDSACMSPIADLDFVDGAAEVTVDPGFEGYVEVMATDIAPSLVYIAPALHDDERFTPLVPDALIDTSASLLGLEFNREERGIMIAQVMDCTGAFAAGVTMEHSEADADTTRFFGMLPDDTATATSADGTGGFLNIPEGFGTWTASVEATEQPLDELRFVHRAGWASLVVFRPAAEYVTR